jgi:hypothetical protein
MVMRTDRGWFLRNVVFSSLSMLLIAQERVYGYGIERVPGLSVSSAAAQIVAIGASTIKDGKEVNQPVSEGDVSGVEMLQFRASLQGDAAALAVLRRPGILPITHEVTAWSGIRERIIDVQQISYREKKLPGWRLGYVELLVKELRSQGYFRTSALSRTDFWKRSMRYRIRFVTNDGGLLAGADGKPLAVMVQTP